MVKLNARHIMTLPAIGGVRTDYRDELLPGFFLRVTPQGTHFGPSTDTHGWLRGPAKPGAETQRDRVLSEDEIRAAGRRARPSRDHRDAWLMLVTAQRRGEVLSMLAGCRRRLGRSRRGRWNGRSHRALSQQALAILERRRESANGPWVFPSPTTDHAIENPQKAAERLRERSKVPDLRLHDFRRTAASLMTGMGISRLTVKKILNHAERDVTAIYDRHSYDPEKRTALEAWGRRLDAIVSAKPTKSQVAELSVVPQQATRT